MSRTILALAVATVNVPTLADSLPLLSEPVPTPAYWWNPTLDADLSPGTAAALEYEAWLADQEAEADLCEVAARRDEELDSTPAGVDCGGLAFGGDEPTPRELAYEVEMGVMFCDEPEPAPAYW